MSATKLADYAPKAAAAGRDARHREPPGFHQPRAGRLLRRVRAERAASSTTPATRFPVAEAPLDFTRVIAPYVRHVHLKDYRVQWTDEGFRLVRCAIGDGAVPFKELFAILAEHHDDAAGRARARRARGAACAAVHAGLVARLSAASDAEALAACLLAARRNRLRDDADYRTPWERKADGKLDRIRTRADPAQRREHARRSESCKERQRHDQGTERQDRIRHRLGPRPRPASWPTSSPALGADVAIHDLDWNAPAKYGEARTSASRQGRSRRSACAPSPSPATSATSDAVEKMKADIEAKLGPVEHPGQLRRRRYRRVGRQAGAQQCARHPATKTCQALTNNNLIGTMLMCQAFVPPMVKRGRGIGRQHRLDRRACRLLQRRASTPR